jgi:hypothetical protein|eukprot:COSAG01_NODE_2112_length_8403_cov_15.894027_10_plen_80_part_00
MHEGGGVRTQADCWLQAGSRNFRLLAAASTERSTADSDCSGISVGIESYFIPRLGVVDWSDYELNENRDSCENPRFLSR